ncbi:hypothetical protein [Gorillibacterium sp. sgz500922]|uniref:hypothetical protein n=1 Tax=Gorillibacterium sp. sgz500922 TaxID=3446694 RepID=UPI003F6819B3
MALEIGIKEWYDREHRPVLNLQPGETQAYRITMKNNFLNSKGAIFKWQKLEAEYTRETMEAMTGAYALNQFAFQAVQFSSSQKPEPIHWTFAENILLPFYLIGYNDQDAEIRANRELWLKVKHQMAGFQRLFAELPKLPSVYLFLMQVYDIISFEIFTSALTSLRLDRELLHKPTALEKLSGAEFNLGMGLYSEQSLFKNGPFDVTFRGYTLYNGLFCALFHYRCDGSKVRMLDEMIQAARDGSSYYSGELIIELDSWSILAGTMEEDYLAVQDQRNIRIKRSIALEGQKHS